MKSPKIPGIALLFSLLVACGGGGGGSSGVTDTSAEGVAPPLALTFSTPPIDLDGIAASYAQDVRYGDGERNLFDIYLPECDAPTALVIYIHGGGFVSGDKELGVTNTDIVRELLQSCVAYASVNYFLLTMPEAGESTDSLVAQGGILTSLRDIARSLQFMRYHAASLNLDPERVAVFGLSAGAGAGLWLGTHDDLADPANADPVLRQSTRVQAVSALSTQATYDMLQWEEILRPLTEQYAGELGGTDIATVMAAVDANVYLLTILGVSRVEDIFTPENEAYRAEVDMLRLMDGGDAPIYVYNFSTADTDLLVQVLHHGLHARAIKDRADQVGLESVVYAEDAEARIVDPSDETTVGFLLRHLR